MHSTDLFLRFLLIVKFSLFSHFLFFFLRFYLFIFGQRGREGEREGEKHQYVVAYFVPPTGDLARNPGMCPDWESNQRPFGLQAGTQSTEPHQQGLSFSFLCYCNSKAQLFDLPNVGKCLFGQRSPFDSVSPKCLPRLLCPKICFWITPWCS